jgi:hypothetical protein
MPIKRGNIAFTGTDGVLCGYFSHGINIFRAASPLTGARVKTDPAFEGFRRSGNRMKEASPIAAALYNQVPKEKKQFTLYRLLTGEALKMIKEGIDKILINEKLYQLYIEPVLQGPVINKRPKVKAGSKLPSPFAGQLFTTLRSEDPRNRVRSKHKRKLITNTGSELAVYTESFPLLMEESNSSTKEQIIQPPNSGPVYLGRLKGHRRFKMWLLPDLKVT